MKLSINSVSWLIVETPSPFHPKLGNVHGYTEPYKKRIVIDSLLPYWDKLETYLHELIHAVGTEVDIEILYGLTADEELVEHVTSGIVWYIQNGLARYRKNKMIAEKVFYVIFKKELDDYCTDEEIQEFVVIYTDVLFTYIVKLF
jgi:hypothetical protein